MNFQGSSFEHSVDFVWTSECSPLPSNEWSLNLTGILPCMTFIPEGTSSPFTKNFAYFFIYDKKKHLVWSIFIEQHELWHLETVKRSWSTAVMFRKCTSPKIVHEFIHSSAFLAILINCRFPLTYSCVLFGGRLKFLLLR